MLDLLMIGSLQELYNVIFLFVKSSFKLNQADIQNDWEVLLISQKIPNNYWPYHAPSNWMLHKMNYTACY